MEGADRTLAGTRRRPRALQCRQRTRKAIAEVKAPHLQKRDTQPTGFGPKCDHHRQGSVARQPSANRSASPSDGRAARRGTARSPPFSPAHPRVTDSRTSLHTIVCTDLGPIVRGTRPCAGVPHRSPGRLYIGMTRSPTNTPPQHDQEMPSTRPLLVDVMHAAEILSLSRSTIYQLIWTDQLTPTRIGRSIRFPVKQLEQFVADRIAESER